MNELLYIVLTVSCFKRIAAVGIGAAAEEQKPAVVHELLVLRGCVVNALGNIDNKRTLARYKNVYALLIRVARSGKPERIPAERVVNIVAVGVKVSFYSKVVLVFLIVARIDKDSVVSYIARRVYVPYVAYAGVAGLIAACDERNVLFILARSAVKENVLSPCREVVVYLPVAELAGSRCGVDVLNSCVRLGVGPLLAVVIRSLRAVRVNLAVYFERSVKVALIGSAAGIDKVAVNIERRAAVGVHAAVPVNVAENVDINVVKVEPARDVQVAADINFTSLAVLAEVKGGYVVDVERVAHYK